jgi:hypothetical protein
MRLRVLYRRVTAVTVFTGYHPLSSGIARAKALVRLLQFGLEDRT